MMPDFDYNRLDELIHSRIRLAAMAVLAGVHRAEFTFIRDRINATDGNLSTHLRKLEDGGYVTINKRFKGRKPVTEVELTGQGRAAFAAYVRHLDTWLEADGEAGST